MQPSDQTASSGEVETHRVIDGRRWRVSDPRIPEPWRQALVNELMSARRAVRAASDGAAEQRARRRVHDAKVALGERGLDWWRDEPDAEEVADRILRTHRAVGRTSEPAGDAPVAVVAAITSQPERVVARVVAGGRPPPEDR